MTGDAFDHLAVEHRDDQRHPGGHGEYHGGATECHRPLAGDARHCRHRILV